MRAAFFAVLGIAIGCLPSYGIAPPCGSPVDPANCGTCGHVCGNANTDGVACKGGACVFQCAGVFAHCSADDGAGCETNLGTSPTDCGACGHSCGGGQCLAGQCAPVLLAGSPTVDHGLKTVYSMVAFGGSVYGTSWVHGGLVFRIASTPPAVLEWIVGDVGTASHMATDGASLVYGMYWDDLASHRQGIWKVDIDGSNDTRIVAGDNSGMSCATVAKGNNADWMAFDGAHVYFTHSRDAGSPCPGIVRADADGANAALFLGGWRFASLAVDDAMLYAINVTTPGINSAEKTSLSSRTVLAQQGVPTSLQIDATHVYWLDQQNRAFRRVPKSGGAIEDVTPTNLTDVPHANFLVDEHWLYFVTPPSDAGPMPPIQQIQRAKKDAPGAATVVAKVTTDNVSSLAQDEQAIYWATLGESGAAPRWFSTIYKLAK